MTFPETDTGDARTPDPWTAVADTQEHLLATIDALAGCPIAERSVLLDELQHDLTAHTAVEEDELYRALLGVPDAREQTRRSIVEHRDLAAAVQELRELGVASNRWHDKLAVLEIRLRRHYERELHELVPIAKRCIQAEQLVRIEARLQNVLDAFDRAPASAAA